MVEFAAGTLRYAPNLAWREVPLRDLVSERTGLPCVVDNDANVAAWAEYRFGAARDFRHVLLVTVGTGIGGGVGAGGGPFPGGPRVFPRNRATPLGPGGPP